MIDRNTDTNHPQLVDDAGAWIIDRNGDAPTFAIDDTGRYLVRSFFYGASAWSNWACAVSTAKSGGFLVDTFVDEHDPAIVIDAGALAAATR